MSLISKMNVNGKYEVMFGGVRNSVWDILCDIQLDIQVWRYD